MPNPKILFIETQIKERLSQEAIDWMIKELPETIYLAYTIQYKPYAQEIKQSLAKYKKIVGFLQVIGCSRIKTDADAILLIGSGRFHALQLALSAQKEVYIIEHNHLSKINQSEINTINNRRQTQIKKFLGADTIGIIISLKQGQNNYKKAERLAEKLRKLGKRPFLFVSGDIKLNELENFPIQSWVNTACPGLEMDKHILNLRDIEGYV